MRFSYLLFISLYILLLKTAGELAVDSSIDADGSILYNILVFFIICILYFIYFVYHHRHTLYFEYRGFFIRHFPWTYESAKILIQLSRLLCRDMDIPLIFTVKTQMFFCLLIIWLEELWSRHILPQIFGENGIFQSKSYFLCWFLKKSLLISMIILALSY